MKKFAQVSVTVVTSTLSLIGLASYIFQWMDLETIKAILLVSTGIVLFKTLLLDFPNTAKAGLSDLPISETRYGHAFVADQALDMAVNANKFGIDGQKFFVLYNLINIVITITCAYVIYTTTEFGSWYFWGWLFGLGFIGCAVPAYIGYRINVASRLWANAKFLETQD